MTNRENMPAVMKRFVLEQHLEPITISGKVAFGFVKVLRFVADSFFAKRYGHRAVHHGFDEEIDKKRDVKKQFRNRQKTPSITQMNEIL